MKTNCCSKLESVLQPLDCDALARQTGFVRRQPKKLWPLVFIQSCCLLLVEPSVSFRRWAILIGALANLTYSKQALFERMGARAVVFVQRVLLALISHLSRGVQRVLPPALSAFKRVLIQDSTILTLPERLAACFPGARSQHRAKPGMIRVQGLYELKTQRFVHFSHSAFVRNDLTAAPDILHYLRAGDLLLRDLGYLVLEVLGQIHAVGAYFVSRFKHSLSVFEPEGQPLDLVALLRHRTHPLDQDVLLGAKEHLPARLVAFKVPEEVANLRRHRARPHHHSPPTQRHLALMGWDLLITNVSRAVLTAKQVAKVYGLRFHIETIFKAWKSHFHLEAMPAGSRYEVETLLYARLLLITIFETCFLARWGAQLQEASTLALSRLKVAAFFTVYLSASLLWQWQPRLECALLKQVAYHCPYERRRKRKNFVEKLELT